MRLKPILIKEFPRPRRFKTEKYLLPHGIGARCTVYRNRSYNTRKVDAYRKYASFWYF